MKNPIQFQKGLSSFELSRQYGTEAQCEQAQFGARWPDGFVCSECGHTGYCEIKPRKLYPCHLLSGHIQLDDAYWGGERHGGKCARGAPGKVAFVAAVQVTEAGHVIRMRLIKGRRLHQGGAAPVGGPTPAAGPPRGLPRPGLLQCRDRGRLCA